jgi:hypothetical protein
MHRLKKEEKAEARVLFHELWTRDVGTDGYDREKWMRLERLLEAGIGYDGPTLVPKPRASPRSRKK